MGERLDYARLVTEEFSRLNGPRLTAEHVVISGDALFAAMAAGSGPDVTQTSGSWFSDYAEKGQLQDITAFVKRDKVDMNRWYLQEETFIRKGKQYGMPFWQAHSTYLYNKTLFQKHGVPLPDNENWTWAHLLDAAQKLTKPGETFGLQMGFGFEFAWLNFLRSAGRGLHQQGADQDDAEHPRRGGGLPVADRPGAEAQGAPRAHGHHQPGRGQLVEPGQDRDPDVRHRHPGVDPDGQAGLRVGHVRHPQGAQDRAGG